MFRYSYVSYLTLTNTQFYKETVYCSAFTFEQDNEGTVRSPHKFGLLLEHHLITVTLCFQFFGSFKPHLKS